MPRSRNWIVLLSLLLLSIASIAQGAQPVTLEGLLSAPIPDPPVTAARAEVIAWSANERGVRNAWVARAPQFEPRRLTAYDEDDGQPLTSLKLSADGRWLAYVRGSAPDAAGTSSNPDSDPDGAEQAVWIVPVDGSAAPRQIAPGKTPLFAPQGDALLVHAKGRISCHTLAPDRPAPAWCVESLLKARGNNIASGFSPDGRQLLFTSNRGDHAFIGVLDLHARQVRWVAPDFNRDSAPAWSPDGRRIAFLRTAGLKPGSAFNLTAANAFEVWSADAVSGNAMRLHRSSDDAGGYAQFGVAAPLQFARDGRVVFASEQGGWLHWHAVPASGGTVTALTRGACEAETATLADDGTLLFSGNCDDIERRQLFAVDARGSTQRRLSALPDIATDAVPLAGDAWLAFRHADARLPTAIAVMAREGGEARRIFPATLPAEFPLESLVQPETVRFRAADGLELHAQLFEPPSGHAAGKRAALLYVHGGPIRQMLPGWHYGDYYYHDYANNQWLASQGFVVLSLNFRSGTGYGQAFRRAEGQGPRGSSEYQDVLAAHRYLAALPEVDRKRIGIYGGSYGGYLTAQALARDSGLFAAGVDRHGVHDWRESAKGGDNSGLWGLQPDELELAGASSPVGHLDGWRSPVLIIHGDDDRAVKFSQGVDLVTRLRERGVDVETLVLPDEEHLFLRHATWLDVHARTMAFFRTRLQP